MNDYQNTESGKAILKDGFSDQSALSEALKRKRRKLTETRLSTELAEPVEDRILPQEER